jgi:hypothetical protein
MMLHELLGHIAASAFFDLFHLGETPKRSRYNLWARFRTHNQSLVVDGFEGLKKLRIYTYYHPSAPGSLFDKHYKHQSDTPPGLYSGSPSEFEL